MKIFRILSLLLFTACLVFQVQAQPAYLPLSFTRSQAPVIAVTINGTSIKCIIDTGSDISSLTTPIATQLGLISTSSPNVTLTSISGTRNFSTAQIENISIGSVTIHNAPVIVKDLAAQGIDSEVKGIIGQDILRQFNYLLDYKNKIFCAYSLQDPVSPTSGAKIPFDDRNSQIILNTTLPQYGEAVTLKLDSGTPLLVLFCTASKCRKFEKGERIRLFVGTTDTEVAVVNTLSVGSTTLRNLKAALITEERYIAGRTESGLLPARVFSNVLVNNKEHFVILNGRLQSEFLGKLKP